VANEPDGALPAVTALDEVGAAVPVEGGMPQVSQ
jgi:hypothetical protein